MQGVALAAALKGETAAQVIQGMRKKINPNGNDSTNRVFLLWPNGAFLLAMSCQAGTTSHANQPQVAQDWTSVPPTKQY